MPHSQPLYVIHHLRLAAIPALGTLLSASRFSVCANLIAASLCRWHDGIMSRILNISAYDRVLVIDTQVVLETKPLDQLPWGEFGHGPVLLLVCRQAQSEIDAKKNDGRLGMRARSFNKLLDSFLDAIRQT